jgi:hypothetical protein
MPLQWTVSRPTRLVIAVAKDELRLKDIEDYLDEILAAGALPYRKIFDTTGATLKLDEDDLMALGARIRAYIPLGPIGPLAIVATTERSYGQARMFMGRDPCRRQSGRRRNAPRPAAPARRSGLR